ncbi:MAG: serine/threonine protein kinase [Myxococcales bacterium]|nr:serine/threonine protein kinase [Myxococcales bacterium]
MHSHNLASGSVLQSRYKIGQALQSGGMASIYQAEDLRLGIPIALKVAHLRPSDPFVALDREARLLAGLRHPGIPRVFDLFSEQDHLILVMEFLEGEDLETAARRNGALAQDQGLAWINSLLDILAYLHSQQPAVVHGDIKPKNLWRTPRDELVLLDFGISVRGNELAPRSASMAFSANYASPEQWRAEAPDFRSDLFSVAATLYRLLTGSVPTDVLTRIQTINQHKIDPLRPAHELNPQISPNLSAVLEHALQLDPSKRPQNTTAFKQALVGLPRGNALMSNAQPTPPTPPTQTAAAAPARRPQYEIKRLLGEGGMGQVFLATDVTSQQDVCLKRLRPNVSRAALRQECAAIARLNHPNIVRLFDYSLDDNDSYMVTEFVDGISLSSYIARQRCVAPPVALEIGKQLLMALRHAHENNVLHCDLKPDNIMLLFSDAQIISKVLDFGIAIVEHKDDRGNTTGLGRLAGTPIYMAPEQFRGAMLSPYCDVYSIALIIAEMLTGEQIFSCDGMSVSAIAVAKQERPFALADLRSTVTGLPAGIARALRTATALNPSDRCTASELLQAIQEAVPTIHSPQICAPLTDLAGPACAQLPPGWFDSAGFVGGVSIDYDYRVESIPVASGTQAQFCLRLSSGATNSNSDFASAMQRCPIWHLAGQKIRFEAWLQTEHVHGAASIWLRIDSQNGATLFFDNMSKWALSGNTGWTRCEITTEIPRQSYWINFGILLSGLGILRAARISITTSQGQKLSLFNNES